MMRIVAIGKKHDDWLQAGIERYQKRLRGAWEVNWELLPHASLEGQQARNEESQRILSKLRPTDTVILLDEVGTQFDSSALARTLDQLFTNGKSVVFVIGGAYGVSDELRSRADTVWSLSPLVFPHQLVRLVLIEQLYRAQSIANGGRYHHE